MSAVDGHPAATAAAAVVFLVLVALSLRWHARRLGGLRGAGGGRYDVSAFGLPDAVVAVLLGLWLLANALPALAVSAGAGGGSAGAPVVDAEVVLASMVYFGGIVAVLVGVLAVRGHPPGRVFGLGATGAACAVRAGLVSLLVMYPLLGVAAALGALIPGDFPQAQGVVEFFLQSELLSDKLLVIVMAVVVAPVAEEIVFRGYLYGAAKKHMGAVAAALATAVLFSLVHAHVPSLGVFFLLSLGLNLVVERTGSLLPAMAMHALFNFVSLALMLLFPEMLPA